MSYVHYSNITNLKAIRIRTLALTSERFVFISMSSNAGGRRDLQSGILLATGGDSDERPWLLSS